MLAIKNYGLMWERANVFWGWANVTGSLLGRNRKYRNRINFREQIGVYVLYDRAMAPIYVGQAGLGEANLFARLKTHSNTRLHHRWEYFSWFGLRRANANGGLHGAQRATSRVSGELGKALNEIEAVLIAAMEPRFNKQGSRWIDSEEFIQVKDDRFDDLSNEAFHKMQASIEAKLDHLVKKGGKLDKIARKIDRAKSRL